jgi:hypothetical protein
MWRSGQRVLVAPITLAGLAGVAGLAGCGTFSTSAAPASGKPAGIAISLRVVPTVRSVTVTPGRARFASCGGGQPGNDTGSTGKALGYPNGHCWLGNPGGAVYPITIRNTGIAADIDISGSNAIPSQGSTQWSLCNTGASPAAACTDHGGSLPGLNQYYLRNFAASGTPDAAGLTGTPACDGGFGSPGHCWAAEGKSQKEAIEIIGPSASGNSSTSWTVTITWIPVPA